LKVQYVYPNVSEIEQRGNLLERWKLAKELNCEYVEVPADFIKNKTEIDKTGLNLGNFLTKEAIGVLYKKNYYHVPDEIAYVLHTEPSLIRDDGYGIAYQSPLKWYDKEWVTSLVEMTISISDFLEKPAKAIEIHPGDRRNSFSDIAQSVEILLKAYKERFGIEPLVLLENRTGQFISCGKDILKLWEFVSQQYPQLQNKLGIVLDVQQLYTVAKKKFLEELELIPLDALRGFHIHTKHGVPTLADSIPWKQVFGLLLETKGRVLVNPEVLHRRQVKHTITFCQEMISNIKEV